MARDGNGLGRISSDADVPVTPELLAWSDLIFVMEPRHREKLNRAFSAELRGKRVVCLNIADEYDYQDKALIELLLTRVSPHLA